VLAPCTSKRTPRPQQAIRQALHPQLVELRHTNPLRDTQELLKPAGATEISVLVERSGQFYVALVHDNLHLTAELDVLLLRPESAAGPIVRGDSDNRMKTLLDGLSAPRTPNKYRTVCGRPLSKTRPTR
jgi:hypothetical protein